MMMLALRWWDPSRKLSTSATLNGDRAASNGGDSSAICGLSDRYVSVSRSSVRLSAMWRSYSDLNRWANAFAREYGIALSP